MSRLMDRSNSLEFVKMPSAFKFALFDLTLLSTCLCRGTPNTAQSLDGQRPTHHMSVCAGSDSTTHRRFHDTYVDTCVLIALWHYRSILAGYMYL